MTSYIFIDSGEFFEKLRKTNLDLSLLTDFPVAMFFLLTISTRLVGSPRRYHVSGRELAWLRLSVITKNKTLIRIIKIIC